VKKRPRRGFVSSTTLPGGKSMDTVLFRACGSGAGDDLPAMDEHAFLFRREPDRGEIPTVLNLRPIKGENLNLWKTAWLRQRLAKLKKEVSAIEKELESRNQ
jgi:hypothetical protein